MSESGDYDPGPWGGYDFKSARATYDTHAGRSYDAAKAVKPRADGTVRSLIKTDLIPEKLETQSSAPLVIACDVTGSMGEWPATIFSKLPYLDLEGKEYLGEDMEISFAAVGDVFSDRYPLQVRPFASGKQLEDKLKELVIEGGGGGQTNESYDIAAYYYAHNVDMPNAIKPIFIFIGDEGLYDFLDQEHTKTLCFCESVERQSVERVMKDLQKKFSVYLVRKPYGSSSENLASEPDLSIAKQWKKLLGDDHVCVQDASRVVDVIFGILAKETGRIEYFAEEIEGRQTKDQVKAVMKSLVTVHNISDLDSLKKIDGPKATKSITRRSKTANGDDKKLPSSKSLLDD
jgi:hypothetical protein